jgi:D-arabinose 1-dehydrogenase-like Zn-dependent alcohol dehydrogenase
MGDAAKERRDRGLAGKAPKYDNVMLAAESKYLQEALTLHKQGKLPLEVDSVFPFTDDGVKDAFDKLDTARVRGKVVIKLES